MFEIRQAQEADYPVIYAVTDAAFGQPGRRDCSSASGRAGIVLKRFS